MSLSYLVKSNLLSILLIVFRNALLFNDLFHWSSLFIDVCSMAGVTSKSVTTELPEQLILQPDLVESVLQILNFH